MDKRESGVRNVETNNAGNKSWFQDVLLLER